MHLQAFKKGDFPWKANNLVKIIIQNSEATCTHKTIIFHHNLKRFLSNRYQRIDNLEIAQVALAVLSEHDDFAMGSLEVTEQHLYIKVISELFRKETIATSNKAYLMKIEDVIRGALNEQIFRATVEKMRKANTTTIDIDPEETVKSLSHTLPLSEPERIRVTDNYIEDENFTQYGLANAVTKTANKTKDYERATELERLGGIVLDTDIKALLKKVDSRKLKKLF